jgi:hypothetical protein
MTVMPSGLLAERVRRDIEVVARGGLDLDTFLSETLLSLRRAVPFEAVCFGTVDPTSTAACRATTSATTTGG